MDEFILQLLQDAGMLSEADPQMLEEMKIQLAERAAQLINRRLVEQLKEAQLDELDRLLDDAPDDVAAYQDFITRSVPDQARVYAMALVEFRGLYLGSQA